MESQPERWRYDVPLANQSKLQPLLRALERLRSHSLTAVMVVAAFHCRRVLPLMARWQCLFEMTPDSIRLFAVALSDEEILRQGMRDVRASPPPVLKDAERRAENRAHAKVYKERKDAEEARRKRKSLEGDELEKHRQQQGRDGLSEEPSPSSSSMDFSSDDDESEAGRGPLDHLSDVRETATGASVSNLASLGGGEGASGLVIARPKAEADTPETRASRKRAVSPMGSTVEVERATAGATQPPPQRTERALESNEGRPVPVDIGVVPLPPPPPLPRTRDAVWKLLLPHSSQKHQAEAPALVPLKALKVSTSSTARWVVDTQTAVQRGAMLAMVDLKEPVAQGEATEAATKQTGEEVPTPHKAGALESGEADAPSIVEATEGEAKAPRTSEAEVAEAGASRASEAEVVDAGAPRTIEAEGALHTSVKRALAVISSHYAGINLEAISDGYVVAEDDKKAEEEVMKLVEATEAPSTALARLFKEEKVPPTPTANAGDPEF
ncbi:uncharacterized protein [Miscanthus floridulus]|uniref:uncharacterized protein n=1 Tax=Miscanthus floridulus TaxID=154761 RepID=UPI003459F4E2